MKAFLQRLLGTSPNDVPHLIPGANAALPAGPLTLTLAGDRPLDSAIYRLDASGKVRGDDDMIFYNQPRCADGSVVFEGDEQQSRYHIDLAAQPAAIQSLVLVCSGEEALRHFGQLALTVHVGGDAFCSGPVPDLASRPERALIIGELYRRGSGWKIRLVAQGFVGGLKPLSEHFGVVVADEDTGGADEIPSRPPLDFDTAPLPANWQESNSLARPEQHRPLLQWLAARNIVGHCNPGAVDMRGYYDEAAALLGADHESYRDLLRSINWAYRQQYQGTRLDLNKRSPEQGQKLLALTKALYGGTLLARYQHDRNRNSLYLKLQQAVPVRRFFGGEWLEWYALGALLTELAARPEARFSCARNLKIEADGQHNELDVVLLPAGGLPLVVECKSGNYHQELDKHIGLRKRLGLPASHYLILSSDLDAAAAASLGAMYPLTFVGLREFLPHCRGVLTAF